MIPAYLNQIEKADHYYGKLVYLHLEDMWMIEGEPCVVEMAKRLFPGSNGKGSGHAKFKNTKRINGDLNWLMQRFPLIIEEPRRWKAAYSEAVDHVVKRFEILKQPQSVTPSLEFKGELKEFQKEGNGWLIHNRRTLLADEMGLGKTVQALAFLSTLVSYPSLLVLPAHLIKNWEKSIERFVSLPQDNPSLFGFNEKNAVHVIKGLRPYELPKASLYIIHYLLLRGWKNVLPDFGFKTVIFDEIQDLRHTGTEKYSAASLISSSCENAIGLSGTPIYNRGGEIWAVMNIIEYHSLGDWDSFTREWCYGYGNDVVKDPALLGDYLRREGLMIRRTKAQVLKELPPKRRVIQTVDFDEGKYSELIQSAVDAVKNYDLSDDFFERGRLAREAVDRTRRAIGIAKAPWVAEFVRMLLDAGEKVLLFAYHHDVWDIYREELREFHPVFITGHETAVQKDQSIEAFKNNRTSLCCVSLRAAAGIDGLQSANCVVFGELDWSPAIHSQAEDRIQRIGVDTERDSILCYYLVAEEGADETIQEFLGLKVSQFTGIMGDKAETEEDKVLAQNAATEHMNSILQRIRTYKASRKAVAS